MLEGIHSEIAESFWDGIRKTSMHSSNSVHSFSLGFYKKKTIIFYDSLSAICLDRDQLHHERTKHIGIRYCFISSKKKVKVQKVDTR